MDKIVQEGIRVIINVIYEPIFSQRNWNFGFRPGFACINALDAIDALEKVRTLHWKVI